LLKTSRSAPVYNAHHYSRPAKVRKSTRASAPEGCFFFASAQELGFSSCSAAPQST
jgi:hypothetical protein